jgi:hypothetical protein
MTHEANKNVDKKVDVFLYDWPIHNICLALASLGPAEAKSPKQKLPKFHVVRFDNTIWMSSVTSRILSLYISL